MKRKRDESEFKKMMTSLGIWAHKWTDVRRCPRCGAPIHVTQRMEENDEEEKQSIVDYLIFVRLPLPRRWKRGTSHVHGAKRFHEKDHLVIIGFGMTGRNIAKAARETKIPYAVLDMNPDRVRDEREKGEPIFYGDATHEPVLAHVNIRQVRTLAIVINDAAAARRITTIARHLNRRLHIIIRTRFREEITPLMDLGANEVIPEEYEASVEIFSRILSRYLLPEEEIHRFVADIRSDGSAMFRNLSKHATSCPNIGACMPDMDLRSLRVHESSRLAGKTIGEAKL